MYCVFPELIVEDFSSPTKHPLTTPKISAVYCLAVHSEGLWLLSGLEVSVSISVSDARTAESTYKRFDMKKGK